MPVEDRRIIFDYREVYKAIHSLCIKKEMKKPPIGAILEVTDLGERQGQEMLLMRIGDELNDLYESVEYSKDFIAAALMLYCRAISIPLPKSGKKSVMLRDDKIILRVII